MDILNYFNMKIFVDIKCGNVFFYEILFYKKLKCEYVFEEKYENIFFVKNKNFCFFLEYIKLCFL